MNEEYNVTENKNKIQELNHELDVMEKELHTLHRVIYIFVGAIVLIILLLFLNGMLVHHETGLDEGDNVIFEKT